MAFRKALSQPFDVLWRSALVRLPRAVPKEVLYLTSPEGPHPFTLDLKSRGKHEIPLYIFVPPNIDPSTKQELPVVIDFHGGGFFLGSPLEQAPFCSKLARELSAVVISVDYRLGPIDKFPAAVEDAEDVLSAVLDETSTGYQKLRYAIRKRVSKNWKEENKKSSGESLNDPKVCPGVSSLDLDKYRIALSGFSSGGNLALNLAISTTDPETGKQWPSLFKPDYPAPIPLLLYYPAIDLRQLPSERTKPPNLPVSHPFWAEVNDMLAPTYLPRELASHPRASPGLVDVQEGLHTMARAHLVLAELDDLTDQNEEWVSKLEEAGRSGDLLVDRYQCMQHGWTQMPDQMLDKQARKTKEEAYGMSIQFTQALWDEYEYTLLR